jgi:hypothetical protein
MDSSTGHKGHAHRWTLRTGPQVTSSVADGADHRHEIRGSLSGPPMQKGQDHVHELMMDRILIESGPSISHAEASKDMDKYGTGLGSTMNKGILPDLVDPEHSYVFKSGEFGLYDYWYIDRAHNYWKYSNAPHGTPDYDPDMGEPIMQKGQPLPAENPQFFTAEGKKRSQAVPPDLLPEENEQYNPTDSRNIWYEMYEREADRRYIYLDSDVRENVDLWVQYQLRITDANIPSLRRFAGTQFSKEHPKDRVVGAILMLMDQGLYELEDLTNATVSDIEFIDNTVKLLGRKFICDPDILDFLTSLTGPREPSAPLFAITSVQGEGPVGVKHIASILKYLKVSPAYLLAWHASHIFSRVTNRLAFEEIDEEKIEGVALSEVKRVFGTQKDLQYLVDSKLRSVLLTNYKEGVAKSIVPRVDADGFSTRTVFSDLLGRHADELEFSTWLHAQPMHDISPEEQEEVEASVAAAIEEKEQEGDDGEVVDAEGNVQEGNDGDSEVADQEAGAVDTDFGKEA